MTGGYSGEGLGSLPHALAMVPEGPPVAETMETWPLLQLVLD